MINRLFTLVVVSLCFLGFFVGCGGQKAPADFPKLYNVNLSVENNGTPLDGVIVNFVSTSQYVTSGQTDSSGKAVLATRTSLYSAKGVPVGQYKVVLTKEPELKSRVSDAEREKMEVAQLREYVQKLKDEEAKTPRPLPADLESRDKTPLSIDVTENGGELKVNVADYVKR
ncbi:MAG: hypothetical protein ACRC46_14635 [Thermoguttaceae bacterium]